MEVKRYYPASLWPNSPLDCHSSSYARALLRTWPRGGLARLAFPAKSKRQIYAPDDRRSVKCAKIARLLLPQTGGLHHTVTTRMNSTELSKRLELPHHRPAMPRSGCIATSRPTLERKRQLFSTDAELGFLVSCLCNFSRHRVGPSMLFDYCKSGIKRN